MADAALSWRSKTLTNVGKVRKLNEDSCLDRADIGMWVVADGMGGHASGDLASQLIVNTLAKLEAPRSLGEFIDNVEDGVLSANARLTKMAKESNQTSGSTVVTLVIRDGLGAFMWAGDSRLYRLRDGSIKQLTVDHSQVELYIEQGLITRDEAVGHPAGNMVTRAVGASEKLFLDADIIEVAAGDRYLLCSDGLDKHVTDPEMEQIMKDEGEGAAQKLLDITLNRGATDNVTVSIVDIYRAGEAPPKDDDETAVDTVMDDTVADTVVDTTMPASKQRLDS